MAAPWGEYIISTPSQFWSELDETLSIPAKATLEQIDVSLKSFVYFGARYYHEFLSSDRQLDVAVQRLLESRFYDTHSDRMVNLVVDLIDTRNSSDPIDATTKLHVLLHILLQNGRQRPHVFKLLRQHRISPSQERGRPFIKLLVDILNRTEEEAHASGKDSSVEGLIGFEATELLYEVLRVKRLSRDELGLFEERFISHLFEIVEQTRDGDEVYNYTLIRLIIALNEQFMVAGLDDVANGRDKHSSHKKSSSSGSEQDNLVLKILKDKLGESKTFGENLIFILNRLNSSSHHTSAEDLCVSLLILKILYLLFSTASTSEYFYTNDLRVLVDVFIRELLDLPEESEGLRHTYLRVLHPLMNNTQLRMYPYKRPAIRATLLCLLSDDHIRHVSPTTKRLVERNLKAEWCAALSPAPEDSAQVEAEAQIAKQMSAIALKAGPAALSLRVEEASSAGSTLSVNAVADAEHIHNLRKRGASNSSLNPNKDKEKHRRNNEVDLVDSPTAMESSGGGAHLHPLSNGVKREHHRERERRSSRSSSLSISTTPATVDPMTASLESLPPKKVPPPRPPRLAKSMPSTPPELSSADETALAGGTAIAEAEAQAQMQPTAGGGGGGIRARFRRAPPPTPNRPKRTEQLQQAGLGIQ